MHIMFKLKKDANLKTENDANLKKDAKLKTERL